MRLHFFLYLKTVQPKKKKKKKKIGTHDAFWNWLFSLIPYTRQIIISKHVCCIWEHLRSLVVLARSALSISNHKANHYQVFISLRSETDYSLQTASSDNHTHWQTMAGDSSCAADCLSYWEREDFWPNYSTVYNTSYYNRSQYQTCHWHKKSLVSLKFVQGRLLYLLIWYKIWKNAMSDIKCVF